MDILVAGSEGSGIICACVGTTGTLTATDSRSSCFLFLLLAENLGTDKLHFQSSTRLGHVVGWLDYHGGGVVSPLPLVK